ncbi:hypothetical protein PHISCL_05217 [Aspergillus sclerotialis]|uniref:AA1-like domain-containing protein n=1 Tax=Aspergillus sclerotialis TaxID=2070753 RepID=A0A3A2ZIS3_9EURO|nr:hypothetical protein PHISCL_05217 [Aspergillus sclerotialis]
MKLTIASLILAATSVFAAPSGVKRDSSIQISDFRATSGASMHFVVTDSNYPDDTPTDCNLIWQYGESPNKNARCNNSQYYIRFPNGPIDLNRFTLELERVSGDVPEKGQVLLSSNANGEAPGTKWNCHKNEAGILFCSYDGVLEMQV